MRRIVQLLISIPVVLSILLLYSPAIAQDSIDSYKPLFTPYRTIEGLRIAVREFERNGKKRLLAVDPYEFSIFETDPSEIDLSKPVKRAELRGTPFMKALTRYTGEHASRLQNAGVVKGGPEDKGIFITIDMCPSKKKIDRDIFTAATDNPALKNLPMPVAIAISGMWIEDHQNEFAWLQEQVRNNGMEVTWVNHSYSHPYHGTHRLDEDFLLSKGVDFEKEVLEEEALLIKNGALPSPFFRFPGLVSNKALLGKLKALSLIPLGANAWLAKGEDPKNGSIILVHGNGNDPEGVKKLLEFYRKNGEKLKSGELKLLPLKEAVK